MLFTEFQNFAAFKSYHILKFANLVGFLIKKDGKFTRFSELLLDFQSKFAEIWNRASIHIGKKSGVFFFFGKYYQLLILR